MARDQEDYRSGTVRVHKRLTQALAVFIFALLGMPLSILCGRRNVMVAFGISFAIVLFLFYPLLIFGQIIARAGLFPLIPAMWAGNGVTFLIGLALLGRVARQ